MCERQILSSLRNKLHSAAEKNNMVISYPSFDAITRNDQNIIVLHFSRIILLMIDWDIQIMQYIHSNRTEKRSKWLMNGIKGSVFFRSMPFLYPPGLDENGAVYPASWICSKNMGPPGTIGCLVHFFPQQLGARYNFSPRGEVSGTIFFPDSNRF